jgi:PKD repeat protein
MTIIGTNVAPTAHITGVYPSAPLVTTSQESVSFAGNFSDPGVRDTHAVTWNFGDGTSSAQANYGPGGSASFSTSHAYASAGTYTVRLLVVDGDGGVGQATTTVTVQTTQQALTSISNYLTRLTQLTDGQRNSLEAKLRAAAAAAARGDRKACNNQLNAFLNELDSYAKTGKISSADAAKLEAAVYAVKGSLGTYNRFLEWWPLAI